MAYQRPQEHAFVKIEKDIKAWSIPGVVLLCGKEAYLTDHYRERLIDEFVEPAAAAMDLTEIDREKVDPVDLVQMAETISLLSPRKVILIRDFIDERGKYPKAFESGEIEPKAFFACLSQIPPESLVILTASVPITTGDYKKKSDGRKLKKLGDEVKKAGGNLYDFGPLDPGQLNSFVIGRMKRAGKECTTGALRRIVNETGYSSKDVNYDLYALENDLKKVIAHAGERKTITDEDLDDVLTINPENNVFHMLDAIISGRKDRALLLLNKQLEDGESEFGILSIAVRQLELMFIAAQLRQEGAGPGQITSYLVKEEKTQKFRAENVMKASSRMPLDGVKHMFLSALSVEEHVKTGLMDSRLALEYFISESR